MYIVGRLGVGVFGVGVDDVSSHDIKYWRSGNLPFVDGDATRGTTTLVYLQLHISWYTDTVHVLSRVTGIHPLVWPPTRDVGRCPQGSPRALALAGRRRGQRSNLLGGARWRKEYRVCGTCEGTAGPGRAKTSSPDRKTVLGPSRGGAGEEGVETSGSENETRLVAAGPPGCEPGGLPRRRRLPGVASAAVSLVDADMWVWVYRGTVYSAKGTTWSGSPLWKETQREVPQHWFIYSYISTYIQTLYMYCPGLLEYIH
jgi:hypothetical protein